jgi:hypothetical protein
MLGYKRDRGGRTAIAARGDIGVVEKKLLTAAKGWKKLIGCRFAMSMLGSTMGTEPKFASTGPMTDTPRKKIKS